MKKPTTPRFNIATLLRFLFWLFMLMPTKIALASQPKNVCIALKNDPDDRDFLCGPQADVLPKCDGFRLEQHTPGTINFNYVLLGEEDHNKRETTNRCINHLTKEYKKHRVYIEAAPAGETVSCKKYGVSEKSGRECMGWDDMIETQKIRTGGAVAQQYLSFFKKEFEAREPSDALFDSVLEGNINKIKTQRKGDNSYAGQINAMELLLKERKSEKSYKEIFKELGSANNISNIIKIAQDTKASHSKRNRALMKTLADNPSGLFAVVVAGRKHLIKRADEVDVADAAYVQQELKKGENGNPYAILTMVT